jgi:hypothetical protein
MALWVLLLGLPCRAATQQPPSASREYTQVAEGVLASSAPLFVTDSIPRYHLEIRDFIIGPNKSAPRVPIEGFAVFELRAGMIETTIGGKAVRRETGNIWLVPARTALAVRNLGEVAILRATVLVPR